MMSIDKRFSRKPKPDHPWKLGPACDTRNAERMYRKLRETKKGSKGGDQQ